MADQGYLSGKRKIFKDLWTKPTLLKAASVALWGYQSTGLRSLAQGLGLTNLLPGDLPKVERIIGRVPRRSARKQLPEINPSKGKRRYRVGYFLGCATDLFYPEIAKATVQVLTENGCEVVIPRNLSCCGMPQMANGAYETTVDLARLNIETYEHLELDYIVTDCGTCTATIGSHGYANLLSETPWAEKAQTFSQKVVELTTFLTTKIDLLPAASELALKVTYHDPCHLAKALKITAPPRNLLKSLPGVQFVEMANADRCCGGAGTFSLSNYDLSMKILDKKMASVKESGAKILATGCPTCTMQLNHGLNLHGINCKVMHPVELLATAYRGKSANAGKLA
jgi:glycolate oxidase iron-sulfur subunit